MLLRLYAHEGVEVSLDFSERARLAESGFENRNIGTSGNRNIGGSSDYPMSRCPDSPMPSLPFHPLSKKTQDVRAPDIGAGGAKTPVSILTVFTELGVDLRLEVPVFLLGFFGQCVAGGEREIILCLQQKDRCFFACNRRQQTVLKQRIALPRLRRRRERHQGLYAQVALTCQQRLNAAIGASGNGNARRVDEGLRLEKVQSGTTSATSSSCSSTARRARAPG